MATPTSPAGSARFSSSFLLQCLVALIPLVLLPTGWGLKPIWKVDPSSFWILGFAVAVYITTILLLIYGERRGRPITFSHALLVCSAALLPMLLVIPVLNQTFSRSALLISVVLVVGLVLIALVTQRWHRSRILLTVALALVAIGMQVGLGTGWIARPKPKPTSLRSRIDTSLYELAVTSYRNVIPEPLTQQGGLTLFGNRYLLATGDGDLYVFDRPTDKGNLRLQRLSLHVPLNTADFKAAMQGLPVQLQWFRVADVLAQEIPGGIRLYASHHFWKNDEQCFVMRVSTLEGADVEFSEGSPEWNTLFDTTPCQPVTSKDKAPHFVGLENGGRLARLNDHELLLSVGDHAMEGYSSPIQAAQDPRMSYGKIIRIDVNTGANQLLSLGHRNPQGLVVTASGRIWSTEHGPRGGDELNLIEQGANYGWPLATYGVEYGSHVWPFTTTPGVHEGRGFVQPWYSWTPSIGVSNLIESNSTLFENWRGDLIVGSLIDRELWRLRVRDNRIVLTEPIPIGERIRDIITGHRDELVLWTDRQSIMFITPAKEVAASGARNLYRVCAACHSAARGQRYAIGPDLHGVVGRRVGSIQGFEYSPAMLALNGVWSKEHLDSFLENPAAAVPGTTMNFAGIPSASARRALIEFLSSPESDLGDQTSIEDM